MLFGEQYTDDHFVAGARQMTTNAPAQRKKKSRGSSSRNLNHSTSSYNSPKIKHQINYQNASPSRDSRMNYTTSTTNGEYGNTNMSSTAIRRTESFRTSKRSGRTRGDKQEVNGFALYRVAGVAPQAFDMSSNHYNTSNRSIPTYVMYHSVWKTLKFRKKIVPFASHTSGKPICVTGVDGFLASRIACELLTRGYTVRGTIQNATDNVDHIRALPQAATKFTCIQATLLNSQSCEEAVRGCDFVIHTGTPSSCSVRDPLSEQQDPGLHSIASRMHLIIPMMTNFIQACARNRVKRVVLTSSIAAMADSVPANHIVNDTSWNVSSSVERNPHFLSLKLAEEAAWQLVEQLPRDCRIDLVTINPGTLFGPSLAKGQLAPGNQIIFDLITGKYSALVDLNWNMVDVRDCALAHIAALENMEARGRYICVNRTVWMKDIVDILRRNGYSGRDLPWRVGLPNWVARLPAYSLQLGQVGAGLYAKPTNPVRPSPYLSDKVTETLNVHYHDATVTILDTAKDLLTWGFIKPWEEDHQAFACGCCGETFTFYRRKHHCRECGVIICAQCSMSRAVVEGVPNGKARLCDKCVKTSIPELVEMLRIPIDISDEQPQATERDENRWKAVLALESLMENAMNHDYLARTGGMEHLLKTLRHPDDALATHAAGAICALSSKVSSSLQLVLEGAVLEMLEVQETTKTWAVCLHALRHIWKQINQPDFRCMLNAVARVSCDSTVTRLKSNILLTFVHMMEEQEVPTLLDEGLMDVLYEMLLSDQVFDRAAAAHAIKHLVPLTYDPDCTIIVPDYVVDDHEELLSNSSLSDLQFLVKGHIAPINAHKVVLFFRNSYFKQKFGSATSQKGMIEVDNCSYEVFSILLRFLYTGKVDITSDMAQELLRASSFYHVFELQKRVEKFLSMEICVENVVTLLCLADDCNALDLKRNCIPFLMKHVHDVVRLPLYQEHREYATEEVLRALAEILGPSWEASFSELTKLKVPVNNTGRYNSSNAYKSQTPQFIPETETIHEVPERNDESPTRQYNRRYSALLFPSPNIQAVPEPPIPVPHQSLQSTYNAENSASYNVSPTPLPNQPLFNETQNQIISPVNQYVNPYVPNQPAYSQDNTISAYIKTLGDKEVTFPRSYTHSEDLSEGVC